MIPHTNQIPLSTNSANLTSGPDTLTPTLPPSTRPIGRSRSVVGTLAAVGLGVAVGVAGLLGLTGCETVADGERMVRAQFQERDTGPEIKFGSEPMIKVRVASGLSTCSMHGGAPLVARATGGGRTVTVTPPLVVRVSASGLVLQPERGAAATFGPGEDVELALASNPGARWQTSETVRIEATGSGGASVGVPGVVTLRPNWANAGAGGASTVDVVSEMPLEAYLPGVIAKEMYANWPQGAYEMQSVASRSYALHEQQRARSAGRTFDIDSSAASSQAFGGTTASASVIAAVQATRGQVLSDGSSGILRAYFSSCSGGRPASASDVWPTGKGFEYNLAAPLQASKRLDYSMQSPKHKWTVKRTADDVSRRLRTWAGSSGEGLRTLARVRTIEVSKRNEAGRPRKFKITDDRGQTFELGAELMRQALNHPTSGAAAITDGNKVWSSDMEFAVTATDVTIAGRGFGHGVGMCQWSAKAMAEGGMSWREMAKQFYPGSGVRKVY